MVNLQKRNQTIIDAVVEKASRVCPGALALVGVNGSFRTGDFYDRSDLDLLILINDDRGYQLPCTFIQEDLWVGHDLYCITWERLEEDAQYVHPNIAKLLDCRIVYCADEKYRKRLEELRAKARAILAAPFSKEDYEKAEKMLKEAEHHFAWALQTENIADARSEAGKAVYFVENAIAMLNKQYFYYGVQRAYEELAAMKNRPEALCERIESVITADLLAAIKENLTLLLQEVIAVFRRVKDTMKVEKHPASRDTLKGTYEEMVSNWRNKMYKAAKQNNQHLAFMSAASADTMMEEIHQDVDIPRYSFWKDYDSHDLQKNAEAYDRVLEEYLAEYQKAGLAVKQYADIQAFAKDYLEN